MKWYTLDEIGVATAAVAVLVYDPSLSAEMRLVLDTGTPNNDYKEEPVQYSNSAE